MANSPGLAEAARAVPSAGIQKVILAIHGIGDQFQNETILSVSNRFCSYYKYPALLPLGAFYDRLKNGNPAFSFAGPPACAGLVGEIGFAEIYWADIPRRIVRLGYTLQETRLWAKTIVSRVRTLAYLNNGNRDRVDYSEVQQVLEELVSTIGVVESLLFLAKKAGIANFNLKSLLDSYVGDVQIVTEFARLREQITGRVGAILDAVHQQYPGAEIHIVAHSEGTVVSWLALLGAISQANPPEWLSQVRGFMTIGSPIDKHLILWPALFEELATPRAPRPRADDRIQWRNYTDFGDPVGFELDSAREWMEENKYTDYFDFGENDDFFFSRYYLPGEAHVEYWKDDQVFGHFIRHVVTANTADRNSRKKAESDKPGNIFWARVVSYLVAYALPLALVYFGVYIFYNAVKQHLGTPEPLETIAANVTAVGGLLSGVVVLLRMFTLVRSAKCKTYGFGVYVLSAFLFLHLTKPSATLRWLEIVPRVLKMGTRNGPGYGVLAGSALFAIAVLIVSGRWLKRLAEGMSDARQLERIAGISNTGANKHDGLVTRETPWFSSMRTMILFGGIALLATLVCNLVLASSDKPLWPVALAGALLVYSTWLAACLFDLMFVWHRYIRFAVGMTFLRKTLKTDRTRQKC
jgi:hypothetical protein